MPGRTCSPARIVSALASPASPHLREAKGCLALNRTVVLLIDDCFTPAVTGSLQENLKKCFQRTSVGRELLSADLTGSLVSSWKYNPSAKFPTIFILEHRCFLRPVNGLNF